MIEFKNVKFNIDNNSILSDVSFIINDRTTVSFVGNKGAGKTTILKLISSIFTNYYGEILINGIDVYKNNQVSIGFVSDEKEYNNYLTVFDFLSFYCKLYNFDESLIEKEIDRYLLLYSLMSYKYTNMTNLDDEIYKLIDIIRVILMNPDVLLFDNLFFSDNEDYLDKVTNIIKSLNGIKTIVIGGRNMLGLDNLSDNIGILDGGKLIAFGDLDSIYQKAEISRKYVVEIEGDENKAINILKDMDNVLNVLYNDNLITFSLGKNKKISASSVLKELVYSGVIVKSFTKDRVSLDHLLGKL